jgi:hypothetical protein
VLFVVKSGEGPADFSFQASPPSTLRYLKEQEGPVRLRGLPKETWRNCSDEEGKDKVVADVDVQVFMVRSICDASWPGLNS